MNIFGQIVCLLVSRDLVDLYTPSFHDQYRKMLLCYEHIETKYLTMIGSDSLSHKHPKDRIQKRGRNMIRLWPGVTDEFGCMLIADKKAVDSRTSYTYSPIRETSRCEGIHLRTVATR